MDARVRLGRWLMQAVIFAMELCFPFEAGFHASLRDRIASQPPALGLQQKWDCYHALHQDLLVNLSRAERGCWDYFDDDDRAQSDYRMWVKGMITDETARTTPSGRSDPYRGLPRHMTVTQAFLINQDSPTADALARLCNIRQGRLWHRETFSQILNGLGAINFASVESDVLYLIPRDDDWALAPEDLEESKFEYLRAIQ